MAHERGFRRIVTVVSVALLGTGIAFDAISMWPHASVQVALKDGRTFTLERHEPKASINALLTDGDSLLGALPKEAFGPPEPMYDAEALRNAPDVRARDFARALLSLTTSGHG